MELGRVNAYDGECLCFEVLALQKLKHLFLLDMRGLKTMKIHKGALPLLEHLEIGPSPQMREVPSGIRLLKSLKSIHFWGMLREFTRSKGRLCEIEAGNRRAYDDDETMTIDEMQRYC